MALDFNRKQITEIRTGRYTMEGMDIPGAYVKEGGFMIHLA